MLTELCSAVAASRDAYAESMPGVQLQQANFTFPDGRSIVLVWDEESADYIVTADG